MTNHGFGLFPLTPAYGRDYKSKSAIKEAFQSGVDFQTVSGQYCSIRDFKPGDRIELRYALKTRVISIIV